VRHGAGHLEVFVSSKKPDPDEALSKALVRYQILSPYLALDLQRGQRQAILDQLAKRTWTDAHGEPLRVAAETIRAWARRYRVGGLAGLEDKPRPKRGIQALSPSTIELACALKREVPERSLDRIIAILEGMGLVDAGTVRRSTLHRALRRQDLSARKARVPDAHDLDRFEAVAPNDLWQSDMLTGPWLPDPERPGKVRRAWLYAFLDDHSRLVLDGRFSFKGDLPALELVFRRALQKYGQPRRVYYDNGATYRSHHMRQIVAEIGVHGLIFTQVRRPMGHGKIEAFNRFCNSAFIAEVKASKIRTLDELNEAFLAWIDVEYNTRLHSETGQSPLVRWKATVDKVAWVDEEKLRVAFLWKEIRKADKSGLFSLFGTPFQVGPTLARKPVEIRYDPEHLDEVEVWHDGKFVERVRPFQVQPHRRPRPEDNESAAATVPTEPVADYLNHLVKRRRNQIFIAPVPQVDPDAGHEAIVTLFAQCLESAVVDPDAIRTFLHRYGPFDSATVTPIFERLVARDGRDHHVQHYLDAIKGAAQ
jgi:transposase InsO family protein